MLWRRLLRLLLSLFYRVEVVGLENVPKGGALIVTNHTSYIDPIVLSMALAPRPLRFVAASVFWKVPVLRAILRLQRVVPIDPGSARRSIGNVADRLKQGELICVFPEGQISRTGLLLGFQNGFQLMARRGEVPVVPVLLDSLYGSVFSFYGNRFFWKLPRRLPYPVRVTFGPPIQPQKETMSLTRETMLDLGADSFSARPEFDLHLGYACLRSLARRPWRELLVDRTITRRSFRAGTVLTLSFLLAKRWRESIPEKRVGIVLPPGVGGILANLGLVLAGKIPVNLNFTAGRTATIASMTKGGVNTIITAGIVKEKLPGDFPWPENTLDLLEERNVFSSATIARTMGLVYSLPAPALAKLFKVPREGGDAEAGLLFSSGSTGEPKGIPLTHRNILANVRQVEETGVLPAKEVLLGNLPIFHSFGFTIGIWCPLLLDVSLVTTPSPLDYKKNVKVIEEEKVSILLGTPTFYRPYFAKAKPEQLKSLRLVVAGAEKTPTGFREKWEERFQPSKYLEGYGLTETSPVAAVNLPDPPATTSTAKPQPATRAGSVGRMLPGVAASILHPETGERLPIGETGILCLRGANIFKGYLDEPERTAEVLEEGWFRTGDLARFDDDGFLYIEGRLSRFSKLGGEMVPHGAVEEAIAKAYDVFDSELPQVAIAGVRDEAKGEALVLLAVIEVEERDLKARLADAGLPNLWIPRKVRRVEEIPTLASGKLDLKNLQRLAEEGE